MDRWIVLAMDSVLCLDTLSVNTIEIHYITYITDLTYRISSYSFRGNYSFLHLEIVAISNSCRNISFFYLINWIFAAETIEGRKLCKGGNYMRKYGTFFAVH